MPARAGRPLSIGRAGRGRGLALAVTAIALLAALGGILIAAGSDDEPAAAERPNVVVIMTDDQRVEDLGVMDRLRRELMRRGTTFRNAFATFPLCCPSRVTFFTGQYAHNHGVLSNTPPDGGYPAFRGASETLPVALQEAGYRTGHVGKYLNGYGTRGNDPRDVPDGWDQWHGFPKFNMFDYVVNENGRIEEYGTRARDYETDVIRRKATRFIRDSAEGDEPFFLSVATLAPHTESIRQGLSPNPRPAPRHAGRFRDAPFPESPAFNEEDVSDKPASVRDQSLLGTEEIAERKARHRDRLASLLAVDELVARVVDQLRASGELADTMIVYTADNGYLLGEHRLKGKSDLYEPSVRIPLVVRGPDVPAGARAAQLVGNVDLPATILEAAGADIGHDVDGRSLIPLAQDPSAGRGRQLLLENRRSVALRTRRYMYAEHEDGEVELYDLRADPFQLRSLHADPELAEVRERLANRLAELEDCEGEECL